MKNSNDLLTEIKSGSIGTAFLTLLFILQFGSVTPIADLAIALPFFIALYFIFLNLGKHEVSAGLAAWIHGRIFRLLLFPIILMAVYVFYILLNGQNPIKGALALTPYLIVLPALVFIAKRNRNTYVDWIDFTAFVLYLLPTAFLKVEPSGELPFNANGFDSVYHIVLMLSAVYTFGVVRNLKDVGFYPVLNWRYLGIAVFSWAAFYSFVMLVGSMVNFIKFIGHDSIDQDLIRKIALTLLATFLHTAIFEELFFRGLLLNLFTKRIGQAKTWKVFWICGLVIAIPAALLVGYTLKGDHQWFPLLMSLLIFAAAYYIENKGKHDSGVYTGLAITSVIFGLVHYHSHAIIYIGFACVAGWAYGYTYLKTKNVFYSAIVHTLVNSSVVIFGLEFIK
jgi:uncharacterized protein